MSDQTDGDAPEADASGNHASGDDERRRKAEERVEAKLGLVTHLVVFVAVNVAFLIVVGVDWLWVTLFWGIGLLSHAWAVLTTTSRTLRDWKEREIRRELERGNEGG